MPAEDIEKIFEQFMDLVSKEIDVIATRVRYEPAAQAAIVGFLHGLSAAAQKSRVDFIAAVQALPAKDREEFLSSLEKSGVINIMNLLIPLGTSGDAWQDPGFFTHELSKTLYSAANISSWWAGYAGSLTPTALWLTIAASAAETGATIADIASQVSAQNASDQQAAIMTQKINYIMDLPDGVDVPTVPKDTKPVSLTTLEKMLEVCKKFYKFEGAFTPTFAKDKQLIRIGPLATSQLPTPPIPLLVTGFIDLSGMQNHDVVTITTKVLEPTPTPSYVIWRVKTFTGHQSSGMKHFQDFSDLLEVPGDGVEVLIAQSASSHNFDPNFLLTIPYQFLVESTVLPQFVLT